MKKYWLLLMLLCVALVPANANAATSFISYGPTGTISTPYPTITALVHAYNTYLMLNESTLYLNTAQVGFTAVLSNSFPNGADIAITYQSNVWLAQATYTVVLNLIYVTGSSTTRSTLTQQWTFTVAYDAATKAMFTINSTLVFVNSTIYGLRQDYNTRIGQWIPTLQAMNNTMHYWNGTIQTLSVTMSNINAMFSSTGTVGTFMTDVRNYFDYAMYGFIGLGIFILITLVLVIVAIRRTGRPELAPPPAGSPYPSGGYPTQQGQFYPPPPTGPPAQMGGGQPLSSAPPPSGVPLVCPNGHQNRPSAAFCATCRAKLVPAGASQSS